MNAYSQCPACHFSKNNLTDEENRLGLQRGTDIPTANIPAYIRQYPLGHCTLVYKGVGEFVIAYCPICGQPLMRPIPKQQKKFGRNLTYTVTNQSQPPVAV